MMCDAFALQVEVTDVMEQDTDDLGKTERRHL